MGDEIIEAELMSEESVNLVSATQPCLLYDKTTSCVGDMTVLTDDEIMEKYNEQQRGFGSFSARNLIKLFPFKLSIAVLITFLFVLEYYVRHCTQDVHDASHWVSKTMYLPKSVKFSWLNAF